MTTSQQRQRHCVSNLSSNNQTRSQRICERVSQQKLDPSQDGRFDVTVEYYLLRTGAGIQLSKVVTSRDSGIRKVKTFDDEASQVILKHLLAREYALIV